jgi:DNA (cytosine-5)-methyltransferase 1
LNHLDLFSGIGGFALAARWVWGKAHKPIFCEIEEFPRKVLRKHWPEAVIHKDIKKLDGRQYAGTVELITGGFPCKQTSLAAQIQGSRHGLQGIDSSLYWELHRIIDESRPINAIIENVMGVGSWAREISDSLESIGYTVSRFECKASDFGAYHSRRRVFFIANSNGERYEIAGPSRRASIRNEAWAQPPRNAWRTSNTRTLRVANGVPFGLDRIRALGNAVVPQVAYHIMKGIDDQA